jgi:hypothetical protein
MKTAFLYTPIDFRLVSRRVQLGFWRLAIDLLSDSRLLQQLIGAAYRSSRQAGRLFQRMDGPRAACWAAAGLCLGFFTALLGALLFQ